MLRITPVRDRISERFPVASFVVNAPPDRYFEIACATDPQLFRADQQHRRTSGNFATSRVGGLMRAPAGQATYMIPPQQLRRFAGAPRLYYALAAFRGARSEDPQLTLAADRLEQTPSILIAPDFTGKTLDRGRLGPAEARYGGDATGPLVWGGDAVLRARAAEPTRSAPRLGNASASTGAAVEPLTYDDGFDAALWDRGDDDADERDDDGEPYGHEDGPAYGAATSEPPGFEDAPAWLRAGAPLAQAAVAPRPQAPIAPPDPVFARGPSVAPPAIAVPRYGNAAARATHHERYGSAMAAPMYAPPPAPMYAPPPAPYAPPPAPYAAPPAVRDEHRLGGELDGYEDVPDLVRNLGPRYRAFGGSRYGDGSAAAPPAATPTTSARFADFSDDVGGPEALPELAAAQSADDAFAPDDPRHRLRILHRVALAESAGAGYAACAADPEFNDPSLPEFYQTKHVGLSWGFIQFAQRYGSLGAVLKVCNRRDPAAFARVFGAHHAAPPSEDLPADLPAAHLLRVTNAASEDGRLAPVTTPDGAAALELWQEPWVRAFREAGAVTAFQEAQRECADRRYYAPYLDAIAALGLTSVRGHAVFVDRAIHMGGGGALRWITRTIGPVRSQADLRTALAHLGQPDLRGFQSAAGLTVDGQFGPITHLALMKALRATGTSPLPLLSEEAAIAALIGAAERAAASSPSRIWQLTATRLRALRDDAALASLPPEPR